MAAQHLAAIIIQGAVRRFLFRKRIQIVRKAARERVRPVPWDILVPKQWRRRAYHQASQAVSASQSLRQKFLTSPFNQMTRNEDKCMRDFCAALIQATYKMSLTRRLFKYHRFAMYHIAAIQIQWAWRAAI